ncbi:hypothetical protein HFP15_00925 [Amycolatopsis sp. K13G38]|uniref:Trypsin-co-occurring domain-containing protein n=1 Tax=Amycolatopsis acididurans TaxID=2724524 RepID=A0ABX1IZ95_9PSEU|nr:trypco2 family protein [Amycolatopsis acididurans]NKQ51440.1 hypothetical protein [Amycolatopsis acididurans]
MEVTDTGVPVEDLIDAVKAAVAQAGVSAADTGRTLRVSAVQLVLNMVATSTSGAKLEFKIPFIGMSLKFGTAVTRNDTHAIDITLVPPDLAPGHEIREGEVDEVLADAIGTVLAAVGHAAGGEDPYLLKESTVELTFAITGGGSISLGIEGGTRDEITHKLKITLAPVPAHG